MGRAEYMLGAVNNFIFFTTNKIGGDGFNQNFLAMQSCDHIYHQIMVVVHHRFLVPDNTKKMLGSVVGPVIQANGRLSVEDDSKSGCLLYCVSQ